MLKKQIEILRVSSENNFQSRDVAADILSRIESVGPLLLKY